MKEKPSNSTIRTALVLAIACVLVWGGIPAPALAQMAEEAASESAVAQTADKPGQQGDAQAVPSDVKAQDAAIGSGNASGEPDGTRETMADGETGLTADGALAPAAEEAPATAQDQMAEEGAGLAAQSDEADGSALGAQSVSVSNPRVVANSSMSSGQVATWDCVWFGSYPQAEIGSKDPVYASLQSASWDENGDTAVGGVRYRRIRRSDTTYGGHWPSWDPAFRYFRYEPVKWRVLEVSGSRALAVSDVALDGQRYNTNSASVTWETSSIRSWLNGYGASSNEPGTDYSSRSFVGAALSPDELAAVPVTDVTNANNTNNGTASGSDTTDKVFLLFESELHGNDGETHGFASDPDATDEARRCKASDYAHAMGASRYDGSDYRDNCSWWLRTPGDSAYDAPPDCAPRVNHDGCVYRPSDYVSIDNYAVRPALNLDLSSPLVSYAGTVSSDGTADEEGFIQITSVELDKDSYAYDGKNTPSVAVRAGDVYVPSGGYDVSYSNNSGVGTATVTVTSKSPYVGQASATFQIVPRPVTVTADDKYKALCDADPELTATVDGLVGDDAVAYALSREQGEALGEYAITPVGAAEQGNYAVTYVLGRLTINIVDVSNPRVVANSSMSSRQVATWDCVWFGSYPQTEVKPGDAAYNALAAAGVAWDANGDATVGDARYRRISKSDATLSYYWSKDGYGSAAWRYFKYEPIKWRVLEMSGNRALVVSDVALDDQCYNTNKVGITWETSSIRSWLNGYGASSNQPGTDYSNKCFVGTAFSSAERGAVFVTAVANADNTEYGTAGGNDTQDRVFLLSEAEVHGSSATAHGFASGLNTYDEARRCKTSDYARAMGALLSTSSNYKGNCYWWLRSPGYYAFLAARGNLDGSASRDGAHVDSSDLAVRPALNLNLSSSLISYAGTVSSDGTADEVRPPAMITSVELSETSFAYDGQAKVPSVTVYAGDEVVPESGYEVDYANNVGLGTATVTVTGKSDYRGTKSATFKIVQPGWAKEGSAWYYYDADGTVAKGWKSIGGKWYYLDPATGAMKTGWLKSGSTWYYLTSSGAMATGWAKVGSAWYYFASSGAMKTGWQKIGSAWYYFNSSGAMVTGWLKLGSTWYYFNGSGAMLTGWQKIGSTWYYFNSSGAMVTGWQKLGSTWYYFNSSGAMLTGRQNIGGKWYTFSSSGAWVA